MQKIFQHIGYHLDLYCKHTSKYQGSVTIDNPDTDRIHGYHGRKLETINATGRKGTKTITFNDDYFTELIPLCGRIVGDRFATLQQARMRQVAIQGK